MPLGRASQPAQVATDMWVDAMGKGSGQLPLAAGPQAGWGGGGQQQQMPHLGINEQLIAKKPATL
jgi:hypothetical protein